MACMVGFHDPDGFDAMTQYASDLGKEFACIRVYMKPSAWGTVTPLFQQVVGAEPHDECSDIGRDPEDSRGTSAEYRAAHQYIVDKFRAANATNVRFGYCGTDPGIFAEPDLCYPGHDHVDVLCHDLYNWGDFRSQRDAWTEFNDPTRWPRSVALAKAAGKPLLIGEFGCHPSAPTNPGNPQHDRNQWFRNAAVYLQSDPDASRHVIGFCYFHSPPPKYDFQFLQGPSAPDGKDGWIEAFSQADYFTDKPRPISL